MCRTQAEAEGLTLLEADNKTGYFGVYHRPGRSKPYGLMARCRGVAVAGAGGPGARSGLSCVVSAQVARNLYTTPYLERK